MALPSAAGGPPRSLRQRLRRALLLAFIPGAILLAGATTYGYLGQLDAVRHDAAAHAQMAAERYASEFSGARRLIHAFAHDDQAREMAAACDALAADFLHDQPLYVALGVVDAEGAVGCSAGPGPAHGAQVAAEPWFRAALGPGGFGVGVSPAGEGAPSRLTLAEPVPAEDPEAAPLGVAFIVLDREALLARISAALPGDAQVYILDLQGRITAGVVPPGAAPPPAPDLARLDRVVDAQDGNWHDSIFAYVPLGASASAPTAVLALGQSIEAEEQAAFLAVFANLGFLGAGLLVAFIVASRALDRHVTRPLAGLGQAAQRLGEGDLAARTGAAGADEVGVLAAAFDRMAGQLEARTTDLARSERRFREMAENIQEVFYVVEWDGALSYVSPAFRALTGREPEAVLGRPDGWPMFVHPQDLPGLGGDLQACLSEGRPFSREARVVRPDGTVRWILARGFPLANGHPGAHRVVGLAADITATKEATAALAEREAQLAEAQRTAALGSWDLDLATGVGRWSEEHFRLLGLPPAERVPFTVFADHVLPEDRALLLRTRDQALADRQPFEVELRVRRADGAVRWLQVRGRTHGGPGGEVARLSGTAQDVTERKAAEARLRESEARLAEAQALAHVGHWENDLRTGQGAWSPETTRIFGIPPDTPATFERFLALVHPDDRGRFPDPAAPRGPGAETDVPAAQDLEVRIVRPDGEVRWVHLLSRLQADPARGVLKLVGTTQDVTERHLVGERLQQAKVRLEELDRFRTQFVNNAAHELKNPLSPIRVDLELLRRSLPQPTPPQTKSLERLDRSFRRFDRLIQDMLDAARLQAGRLPLAREALDLNGPVLAAVEAHQEVARGAGIALTCEPAAGLRVEADARRLAQVLDNLLGNAIKFTPRGGRIHVTTALEDAQAVVRVTDSGPGLSELQIAKLFQPFAQVGSGEDKAKGTGLGLYICRGIVEAHGGRIWAESEGPGCGATFAWAVPVVGHTEWTATAHRS